MCGRYTLNKKADDIARRFNLAKVPKAINSNFNVVPSQIMPVVTESEDGNRQLELMSWGIPRMLGKDFVKEIINTRADKAFGGFWRRTVMNHRCLVPATGFYEWKKEDDGKHPFFVHPRDMDLYAFAGIWDIWKNKDGQEIRAYSIMTTEPNKEMKEVHDRMPVILHQEDEAAWLNPSVNESEGLAKLLFPFEDNGLEIYEVSKDVNNPRNNNQHLLEPLSA